LRWNRVFVIVLDSVGIGELPDAASYGDLGAHTLGHIAERASDFKLPNLQALGLGNIAPLRNIASVGKPRASYGKMAEQSVGKDTMTGHWELMGLKITTPFHTYPDGFPPALISEFERLTGRAVLANKPASGTDILDEFGAQQMASGDWIVYTSADSVLQIAAHEEVIPLTELYRACELARELTMREEWMVGRVIARPYVGQVGAFVRTANRHDYAIAPPKPTLLNRLQESGLATISIGKINDIFCGEGISASHPTKSNDHGMDKLLDVARQSFHGLCFANLVDFDSLYGHRRDVQGYANALMRFDERLPQLMELMQFGDALMITADHGNDPVHHGTDHTREYVPLLIYESVEDSSANHPVHLGVRATFADLSATIAENFNVAFTTHGASFLRQLK
jgi:phosphopentomutase